MSTPESAAASVNAARPAESTSTLVDGVDGLNLNGGTTKSAAPPLIAAHPPPPLKSPTSPIKARDYAALTADLAPSSTPASAGPAMPSTGLQRPPPVPAPGVGSLRARSGQGSSQNVRLPPSLQAKMAAVSPILRILRSFLSLLLRSPSYHPLSPAVCGPRHEPVILALQKDPA